MIIGDNNVFEIGAYSESLKIGDNNVIESKARIGKDVIITTGCIIGAKCELNTNEILQDKYKLIQTYVHPIGFKTVQWKQSKLTKLNDNNNKSLCENKYTEERVIIEHSNNFECFEPDPIVKIFGKKIRIFN